MPRMYASCVVCGNMLPTVEMTKSNTLDRGGKPAYTCDNCLNRVDAYTCGTGKKGKEKSELWTVSKELETNNHTPAGHANLLHNGFVPSSDCSLNGPLPVEYKSPVYQGFGGLVKYCKSIEKMLNSGDLSSDSSCGQHLHIGRTEIVNHLNNRVYDIDYRALDICWEYADELLHPLQDYLVCNPLDCTRVFGRTIHPSWARTLEDAFEYGSVKNHNTRRHDNRYCFVNFCTEGKIPGQRLGKSPEYAKTIEFRINKFINAEQYSKVIMLEKAIVQCIIVNFLDYWNCGDDENSLRKAAQKTGDKILKLFLKALNGR